MHNNTGSSFSFHQSKHHLFSPEHNTSLQMGLTWKWKKRNQNIVTSGKRNTIICNDIIKSIFIVSIMCFPCKIHWDGFLRILSMISHNWNKPWLDAARQEVISGANDDDKISTLQYFMAPPGHNKQEYFCDTPSSNLMTKTPSEIFTNSDFHSVKTQILYKSCWFTPIGTINSTDISSGQIWNQSLVPTGGYKTSLQSIQYQGKLQFHK